MAVGTCMVMSENGPLELGFGAHIHLTWSPEFVVTLALWIFENFSKITPSSL